MVLVATLAAVPALAQDHAVGARIGMLGLGVEYSYRVTERIAVRGGLNTSGYSFEETESGIDYDFDLDFDSLSIGVDVHPMQGAFRVSAGLLRNDSALSAQGIGSGGSYTIGDMTYPADQVGSLRGRVGFDDTAPYIAVGWDFLRGKRVGMSLDLGVVDQGAPIVSLSIDGPIGDDPDFQADLAAEVAELQASLDDLDVYPYVMFGVVFRF
jgi:hypothetical protein